jgi:hypothetical protein
LKVQCIQVVWLTVTEVVSQRYARLAAVANGRFAVALGARSDANGAIWMLSSDVTTEERVMFWVW